MSIQRFRPVGFGLALSALFLCGLLTARQLEAQSTGAVAGRVLDADTRRPIQEATVSVRGLSIAVQTDVGGTFAFPSLEEGVYVLEVSSLGYFLGQLLDVRVVREKVTTLPALGLAPNPLATQGITIAVEKPRAPSEVRFSKEQVRRAAGSGSDPIRALQTLPGVTGSDTEFSALSVRGGGPRDNLILIDGIPFTAIQHFDGGSREQDARGGRFSVFTGGLIDEARFWAGGYPGSFGWKNASVLELDLKEGNPSSHTVDVAYDLLGLEVNYDGPSYFAENTTVVANARVFDFTAPLELVGREEFGKPSLVDVILKTTTRLSDRDKVSLLGIYATDDYDRDLGSLFKAEDLVQNDTWSLSEDRFLFGATWEGLRGESIVLRSNAYVRSQTRDRTVGRVVASGFGSELPPTIELLDERRDLLTEDRDEVELGWRGEVRWSPRSTTVITAGAELRRLDLASTLRQQGVDTLFTIPAELALNSERPFIVVDPETVNASFDETGLSAAAYAVLEQSIGRVALTPSLRFERSGFSGQRHIAPRVSVRFTPTDRTTWTGSAGLYHQQPTLNDLALHPQNEQLEDERAVYFTLGAERRLTENTRVSVEGYYRDLTNLVAPQSPFDPILANTGSGWSSGLDVMLLRRFANRYHGQLSYSYAQSRRQDSPSSLKRDFDFLQPHTVNAVLGYEATDDLFISTTWKYSVGRPKDRFDVIETVLADSGEARFTKRVIERNGDQLKDFFVANVRVDYRLQFSRFAIVSFADVYNVFNRLNPTEDRFSELAGIERSLGFGAIGTGGFKIEF